ncbi:MAG: PAS domain S-box protein, partial [Gemmataceae bacterium]|nr:PAS domain S-box protein [Gemmataceae bacterium]
MGAQTDGPTDIAARARELAAEDREVVYRRTDWLFAWLLVAEWLAAVAVAVWVSPLAWAGATSRVHPHVWVAVGLGCLVVAPPVWLAARRPGMLSTRLAVAAGQMLMSGLLIHLSGGRIETHFHVFGSLAFLAFYRDWRVLAVASGVTAADHLVRGAVWPESVYGAAAGVDWRWAEHAGWVVFIDVFLLYAIWHARRDATRAAEREAALEAARATVEEQVADRTRELGESQELFRSTFDDAAIGMAVLAPDGRFVRVNRALCDLVGYTPDELAARRCADVTHPDDRAADAPADARLLAGEDRVYRREKRYVHRDGRAVWARKTASVVRSADGRARHLIVQVEDVTAARAAAAELAVSQGQLRELFDQAALGMALLSPDRHFLRVNQAFCDLVGYPAEELLAKSVPEITHPDDRDRDADPVARLLAGDLPTYRREKRYVHAGGRAVWVRKNVSVVRDPAGRPVHLVLQVQDVTEEKRAADELRAAQAESRKLALVARYTDNAVVITDAGGVVEWVNNGFTRLTGYDLAEVAGRKPGAVLQGPDTDPGVAAEMGRRVRAGEGFEVEIRNYSRAGRAYWVAVECRPVHDDAGRVTNFIAVESDVTARKEAARALEEAKVAAEAASRTKSEFLANMSHEIRTPMNGILGMTDLVLETDLSREQRESLGLVKSSAEALLGIINDILDFSKIEAGKLELDPTPLFLRDVIGDTLKPFAFGAHEKGLELACDLRPDVPDLAVGDPVRLRQVLTNLVGNAIKFTAQGEVVVRAELVEEAADGFRVRFGVRDTGIGIPANKLESVFRPFEQADGSTTRKFGGSGLGLTICARLVGMMGGRIWVESEVGKGSTFFFEVRLDRARVSAERPAPLSADVRGLAVLVVDDNATNRRVLADTMKSWGAAPTCVDSGPAALAELRRAAATGAPYPLVLLDAMMPGMDGFQVAEEVGKDPAVAGAAVLMLTSADATGDAARCRALGLAAYLVKPVKGSELNAAIAAALHGRPARTRA